MRFLTAVIVLLFSALAHADFLEVRRSVTLKNEPHTDSAIREQLTSGERLELLDNGTQENGYYHARTLRGSDGWVYRTFVRRHPGQLPGQPGAGAGVDLGNLGPWAVHFLDVGTGDSAVVDMGDSEIVIDGGDSIAVLDAYQRRTSVIDGPIELAIVTHGDTDHWNGLRRLLGFDGVTSVSAPLRALEYWDPGYDRDCDPPNSGGHDNYLNFVKAMQSLAGPGFRRPLEDHFRPAVVSGAPEPFTLPAFPGATFTLLHSDANPTGPDCAYKINNASIVFMLEMEGVRFLFTGDANGKERDEPSPGTPGHVERKLLDLERAHPGTLKADVLKVPHHGSQTASTQAFIDAVDPAFAIISASTKHRLPKDVVVARYTNGERVIVRTDENLPNNTDHIICTRVAGDLQCNFANVLAE